LKQLRRFGCTRVDGLVARVWQVGPSAPALVQWLARVHLCSDAVGASCPGAGRGALDATSCGPCAAGPCCKHFLDSSASQNCLAVALVYTLAHSLGQFLSVC